MSTETHLYFAYGSNLDLDQMRDRCPDSELVGMGALPAHRLDFTAYANRWQGGVADVVQDQAHTVWGLIYRLSSQDLQLLDEFESYPTGYDRRQVQIHLPHQAQPLEPVWVYQVVRKQHFIAPHPQYLGIIRTAADQWDFPPHYQHYLATIAQVSHAALEKSGQQTQAKAPRAIEDI
jgi:gamma-glutamylcyclotransferase (GGCT)/AIG2-like uncharacterized protein YtfP